MTKATEQQIGGSHYKQFKIQPMEMAEKLGLPPTIYSAFKYIVRAPHKGRFNEDLDKCLHCLQLFAEFSDCVMLNFVSPREYIDFLTQFEDVHRNVIHAIATYPEHQQYDEVVTLIESYRELSNLQ